MCIRIQVTFRTETRSEMKGDAGKKEEELIASRADSSALGHFRKRRALILQQS